MSRKSMLTAAAGVLVAVNLAVVVAAAAHDQGVSPRGSQATSLANPPGLTASQDTTAGTATGAPGTIGTLYPVQQGQFVPGLPPFSAAGVAGDGVTAWGVAYKSVADATTEPDAALIRSAFDDGKSRAQVLAGAVGLKLGSLAGVSDYTINQPSYGCIQPLKGSTVPPQAPVPQTSVAPAPGGQGIAQPAPTIQPCQVQHYAVAWVLVRFHIQS
jgi:Protein of unknown function (DUF541)